MKRTQTLFALILILSASPGLAWVGGPFSGDDHTGQGSAGTYQGTLRGRNTMGTMMFGSSPSSESYGRFIVYNRGLVYRGSVQAMVDIQSRYVAGNVFGQSVSNWAGQYDEEGVRTDDEERPDVERRGELFINVVRTTDVNGNIIETVNFEELDVFGIFAEGEVASHKNADGWFDCNIYETVPQLRFRGTGKLSFYSGFEATPGQAETSGPSFSFDLDGDGIDDVDTFANDFSSYVEFEAAGNEVVSVHVEGFRSSYATPNMLVTEGTNASTTQAGATIPLFNIPGPVPSALQAVGGG